MRDLSAYRYDVPGFAADVLGIPLHPGQIRFAESVNVRRRSEPWRAAWLTICLSAGNRAGKTLALAVVIIHSTMYKMGLALPDPDDVQSITRFWRHPYFWFHFAIQQEIAELVFTEISTILAGTHIAQKNGCPLSTEAEKAGTKVAEWDKKYNGDYRWIVFTEGFGGGEIHFRTTAERALGSLGRDMHGISFDECGFEPKLQYIVDNVLHLRRLGTGGQLLLVSTPEEGLTEFADLWFSGDPEQPDRAPSRFSMRMSTRDNIGFGIDQQVFDTLVAGMDADHIAQNIDGYFIQGRNAYFNSQSVDNAFVDWLPELQAAKDQHVYAQGADPALAVDAMWSIVADVTDDVAIGVRAERQRGKKTTSGIVELVESVHFAYDVNRQGVHSRCQTAIDATGWGGKMFKEMLDQAVPGGVRAIEFGGTTQRKRKLLGDLRSVLDAGKLKMPRSGVWLAVRRQLLGYKLDDKHIEQDAVMALACLVAEMRRSPGMSSTSAVLETWGTTEVAAPSLYDWSRPPRVQ